MSVVLSLFDGKSCGQIALQDTGVDVTTYYASEIEKHPISVTQYHFPDTIQLGSVVDVNVSTLEPIDILIGGSPCQSFSMAGKRNGMTTIDNEEVVTLERYLELKAEGFEFDGQSYLFWEYVRILKDIQVYNPNVLFFLENVRMVDKWKQIITNTLGVESIPLNSNLVSAQNRWRQYWTNIKGTTKPHDKGILLKDIIHENTEHYIRVPTFNVNPSGKGMNGDVCSITNPKSRTLTTNKGEGQKVSVSLEEYIVPFDKTLQILDKEVERGKVGYFRTDSQANRVYYIHDKAVTLTDGATKMGQQLFGSTRKNMQGYKVSTQEEKGRTLTAEGGGIAGLPATLLGILQKPRGCNTGGLVGDGTKSSTLTSNSWEQNNHALFGCITPDRIEKRQNGQRFSEGKKFYTLTAQDQHGVLVEGYIRKLTPIECERLQTLPDYYTAKGRDVEGNIVDISNSQRYRMIGNGWTIGIISHLFSKIPHQKTVTYMERMKND